MPDCTMGRIGDAVERLTSVLFEQTPRCPVEIVLRAPQLTPADRRFYTARHVPLSPTDRRGKTASVVARPSANRRHWAGDAIAGSRNEAAEAAV